MRLDCVERRFARLLAQYARYVVACPYPFIIVPILLTAGLSSGLLRHSEAYLKDDLNLYTPTNAKARDEVKQLDNLFPVNDTDLFYTERRHELRRVGFIIVTDKKEDADILHPAVMNAAMQLWSHVLSMTVEDSKSKRINYPSLCVKVPVPEDIRQILTGFLSNSNITSLLEESKESFSLEESKDDSIRNNPMQAPNIALRFFVYVTPSLTRLQCAIAPVSHYPEQLHSSARFSFHLTLFCSPDNVCVSNPGTEIAKIIESAYPGTVDGIMGRKIQIDYIDILPSGPQLMEKMMSFLGGVTKDSNNKIDGAKAIILPYALKHSTADKDALAEKWERELHDLLVDYQSPVINVSWWTYDTLPSESAKDRDKLVSMIGPAFAVVSLYTVAMCCVFSWTRSRPLLAIGGVISAAMAIVSGVGVLLLIGSNVTSIVYSMPFIIFSVGVDNVFILLSAWRSTNYECTLVHRLMETFEDAAVSITVTSLTDLISFGVGCMTPFPSVNMFCAYAVAAVLFTYVYQLTFFAGIMVLTCKREVEGRHCLFFYKVEKDDKKDLEKKREQRRKEAGPSAKYWTVDSVNERRNKKNVDKSFEKNHYLAKFFRTTYAELLMNPFVRLAVICGFVFYLGIAIYGCNYIKVGLDPNDLLPDDSYGKKALQLGEKYFSGGLPLHLHVWVYNLSTVDLGDKRIWNVLEQEITYYEYTHYTGSGDSWIRVFLDHIKASGLLITQDNFVHLVKEVFLVRPEFAKYRRDIVFDATGKYLEASRFTVNLKSMSVKNYTDSMHLFRTLAALSDLPTGVYADFFEFAEQYDAILPGTLSSIGYAGAAVIAVSLLLIPEPIASLWVCFSIISINVGILGFMTFWGVKLDFVSMVTIVMSIGFCVDFAAHLAYNFAKGVNLTSSERVRNALYTVGTPILQSASSTIIGVSFMAFTGSYIFQSFLKTIVLVITLGALHGLVILPVLLTMFHCNGSGDDSSTDGRDSEGATSSSSLPPLAELDKIIHNSRLPRIGVTTERPPPYHENRHHAINTYMESVASDTSYPKSKEKQPVLMNGALSRKTAAFSRSMTNLQQDVDAETIANAEYAEYGNVRPLRKSDRTQSQWSVNPVDDLIYHNPVNNSDSSNMASKKAVKIYTSSDSSPSESEMLQQREYVKPPRRKQEPAKEVEYGGEDKRRAEFDQRSGTGRWSWNRSRNDHEDQRRGEGRNNWRQGGRSGGDRERQFASSDERGQLRRRSFDQRRNALYDELRNSDGEMNRARDEVRRLGDQVGLRLTVNEKPRSERSAAGEGRASLGPRRLLKESSDDEESKTRFDNNNRRAPPDAEEEESVSRVIRLNKVPQSSRDTEARIDKAVKSAYKEMQSLRPERPAKFSIKLLDIQDLKNHLNSLLEEEALLERLPKDLRADLLLVKKYLKHRHELIAKERQQFF
uniref:SSD domain-containing protein n=1 Tax=Steinernema glaseri TaxID=37863 RepID=A0A1I7Y2K6_9BILA